MKSASPQRHLRVAGFAGEQGIHVRGQVEHSQRTFAHVRHALPGRVRAAGLRTPAAAQSWHRCAPGIGLQVDRHEPPPRLNAATRASGSVAYEPIPPAVSRSRSRSARSASGRSPGTSAHGRGSATIRSVAVATSKTHSASARSSGPAGAEEDHPSAVGYRPSPRAVRRTGIRQYGRPAPGSRKAPSPRDRRTTARVEWAG